MASSATIKTSTGGDPVVLMADLTSRMLPDEQDIALALENQRTRILERTAQGLDAEGKPFAPYSDRGPFYYYPSTQRGRSFRPSQKVLGKIWDGKSTFGREYFKVLRASAKRMAAKIGFEGQQTPGGGLKFASYKEFKDSIGRTVVDLTGPRAPHMLQAMVVRVRSALEGAIGVYGPEAARASGHHEGNPKVNLPRRRFLGASEADQAAMVADMAERAAERARERLGA